MAQKPQDRRVWEALIKESNSMWLEHSDKEVYP